MPFKSHFPKKIDLYFANSDKYEHPDYGNVRASHCFPVSSLQKSRTSCEEWSGKSKPTLTLHNKEISSVCIVSRNLTDGSFYSMKTRSLSALLEVNPSHILEDNSAYQGIKKSSDGNYYFIVDLYEDEFYPAILENGMSKGGLVEGPFKFVYKSPGNLKLCYLNGNGVKGVISEEKYLNSKKQTKKKKDSSPKVGVDYLSASELKPGFVYERGSFTRSGISQYSLLLEKSGGEYYMVTTFNKLGLDTKSKNKISFSYAELKNSDNGEIINYPQKVLTKSNFWGQPRIESSIIFTPQFSPHSYSYSFQKVQSGYYHNNLANSLGYKVSTKDIINIKKQQFEFLNQDEYFKFLFNREFFMQKCIDFYNQLQDQLGLPKFKEDSKIINIVISNLNFKNEPILSVHDYFKDLINYTQRNLKIKNNLLMLKTKGNPKFGSEHPAETVFDSDLVNHLQKCYKDNKDEIDFN